MIEQKLLKHLKSQHSSLLYAQAQASAEHHNVNVLYMIACPPSANALGVFWFLPIRVNSCCRIILLVFE